MKTFLITLLVIALILCGLGYLAFDIMKVLVRW